MQVTAIAFFDFDGTITSKDTLAEILKFAKGKRVYYTGLIIFAPVLIGYKLQIAFQPPGKRNNVAIFF